MRTWRDCSVRTGLRITAEAIGVAGITADLRFVIRVDLVPGFFATHMICCIFFASQDVVAVVPDGSADRAEVIIYCSILADSHSFQRILFSCGIGVAVQSRIAVGKGFRTFLAADAGIVIGCSRGTGCIGRLAVVVCLFLIKAMGVRAVAPSHNRTSHTGSGISPLRCRHDSEYALSNRTFPCSPPSSTYASGYFHPSTIQRQNRDRQACHSPHYRPSRELYQDVCRSRFRRCGNACRLSASTWLSPPAQ